MTRRRVGSQAVSLAAGVALAVTLTLAGCSDDGSPDTGGQPTAETTSTPPASPGTTHSGECLGPVAIGTVEAQQALDRDEAGAFVAKAFGGDVVSVDEDTVKGRATWEVELRDGPCGRIEVDISKDTGEVLTYEAED